nr:hypothetical protein [Desulfobulbaceae bacterium]
MNDEIKNLMNLQAIDLDVQKIDIEMAKGYGDLDAKRAEIEKDKIAVTEYEEQLELGEKRQRELEALIEDEQERIKDRQTKLMNIQTNREYQSILKEIEDTKAANKQREDELVLLLEQFDSVKNKIKQLNAACAENEEILETETKKIKKVTAKLETDKKKIQSTRDAKALKVKSKHLKHYEKLREKRNGLAVAGVTNGVCCGCNMNIPPQMFNELLREEEILSCPTCNRMMFHLPADESDEE